MPNKADSNLLKGLAILAVISIHACSRYIELPAALFIDQLSRFAVPLFVTISGYGLTMSFGKNNNLLNYYIRRVWKILPWFVLASLIIMIFRNWFENAGFDLLDYHTWTNAVMRGGADYHLYFVPMIFKFYLIFPLLFFVVKKFPKTALLLSLVWQIYWYHRISVGTEVLGNHNVIWPDQMQYLAPETWIFYFVLGIYIVFKPKILNSRFYILLAVVGFILTFLNGLILQGSGINSLVATRFTRLPVILYATGVILWGFSLNFRFKILNSLGKYSYQIYLFHTIILRIAFKFLT
jgi:peptidoglycan/LPS O-acetylase OafA/YrhL